MTGPDVIFLLASAAAAATSVLAVTRRNPVYSAAWMLVSLFAVAVIYLLLHASFLFVVQVLLYAGAILVLFVFVIMLLNPGPKDLEGDTPPGWVKGLAAVFSLALFVALARAIVGGDPVMQEPFTAQQASGLDLERFGSTEWVGATLYDRYLVAFEMISLLIMAAIAAVIVLAKRHLGTEGEDEAGPSGSGTAEVGHGHGHGSPEAASHAHGHVEGHAKRAEVASAGKH